MAHVTVRRVYEQPSSNDGARVLVDRLWPRGLTKERAALDEWCKAVAPSTELRTWYAHDPERWSEFVHRYHAELESAASADALDRLRDMARSRGLTLLTATKHVEQSHAAVLADLIMD